MADAVIRNCKECGAVFSAKRYNPAEYCSSKCRNLKRFIRRDYDTSEYIAAMCVVERIADRHCVEIENFWDPRFRCNQAIAAARREALETVAQAYGWGPRQLGAFFLREHSHICSIFPSHRKSPRPARKARVVETACI